MQELFACAMSASEKNGPEKGMPLKIWEGLFYLGGIALLFAMAVEALAILGRHIGMPLPGSIELVQAAILVASSIAMLSATLAGKHARVRFVADRLKGGPLVLLRRIQAIISVLFFSALAAGSIWIFWDLWGGFEESEVLHIPLAPLRIVCIVSVLGVAFGFLGRFREGQSS
jgi:TRAP-type C4-dicarboxylate transport system permease small subunit